MTGRSQEVVGAMAAVQESGPTTIASLACDQLGDAVKIGQCAARDD